MLDASSAASFRAHLDTFEGRIPWLYLDGPGNVTVGIGCLIATPEACSALEWNGPGAPEAWAVVKAACSGLPASAYATLTGLRLSDVEMNRLRDERILSIEAELIRAIPSIESYPMLVRQAIFDMAFNMGVRRLVTEFFHEGCKFGPAIERRDWHTAAKESFRRGVQTARNLYTQELIAGNFARDA